MTHKHEEELLAEIARLTNVNEVHVKMWNEAEERLSIAIEALEMIEDPRKRTHIEHEPYATIGCMMSIAEQALLKIKGDQ